MNTHFNTIRPEHYVRNLAFRIRQFHMHFLEWDYCLHFDSNFVLFRIIPQHPPELMMTPFADAYMRQQASMCQVYKYQDVLWQFQCNLCARYLISLTYWGRVTHICVDKRTIIDSENGLVPSRRQAIICTNAGILLIRTLGTNFSEILIQIHTFSNKKMHLKMSSGKCRPFCLGLNVF